MSETKLSKNEKVSNSTDEQSKWKKFRAATGGIFSKLSKAFLLPIALLPIAGVFLGIGATITANVDGGFGYYLGSVMNQMGSVAFGNLPILFAISVAIAYTEDSGVSAITAVVGFLVLNGIQAALIVPEYNAQNVLVSYSMLWWSEIPVDIITQNVGITSLNTGVFAAIFVGGTAAWMYNRFHKTQLPSFISFFSGSKLVPIITFVAVIPISFIFLFTWPGIGLGLNWFGQNSGALGFGIDSLVYSIIERSLIPLGLHHVFYAPLWWTSAGGILNVDFINSYLESISTAGIVDRSQLQQLSFYDLLDLPTGTLEIAIVQAQIINVFGDANLMGSMGDHTIMFDVLAQNTVKFTDIAQMGLNLGRFQSGKFGFMLTALPAGAIAMWLNVPKQNRRAVMGIYFSAAFTCFLTGITEPIEFTFLFLAPWLFYGVHMPLASISFFLTGLMQVHITQTVSGGFIDFVVFGLIPMHLGTNWYHVLWIAAIMTPAYFFSFYFAVKYGKVMVPGRDTSEGSAHLYTKADVKAKDKVNTKSETNKTSAQIEKATKIIEFLGGEANITAVDSCASRLRVTVVDSSIINKEGIMSLGGCTGIIVRGQSVHVVYGGEQEVIKPNMREILAKQRNKT